jgi:hypothetical protein
VLEQIIPDVEAGLSLSEVRACIKKLQNQVDALKRVPVPASDIEQKVRTYVERLPMPTMGGIGAGEALTVQWPTGLHALMAFLQPDLLVDRLMVEINRIANTPYPLAERERQIAELEREIDRLQRTEEAIVVAMGAPRERGCPPWVVLGVKAVEARGVRAAARPTSRASPGTCGCLSFGYSGTSGPRGLASASGLPVIFCHATSSAGFTTNVSVAKASALPIAVLRSSGETLGANVGTPAGRPTRRSPGSNGVSSPPLPPGILRIFFAYFIASAFARHRLSYEGQRNHFVVLLIRSFRSCLPDVCTHTRLRASRC